jgi:hypothetical protein
VACGLWFVAGSRQLVVGRRWPYTMAAPRASCGMPHPALSLCPPTTNHQPPATRRHDSRATRMATLVATTGVGSAAINRPSWSTLFASWMGWMFDGYESFALVLVMGVAVRQLLPPASVPKATIYMGGLLLVLAAGQRFLREQSIRVDDHLLAGVVSHARARFRDVARLRRFAGPRGRGAVVSGLVDFVFRRHWARGCCHVAHLCRWVGSDAVCRTGDKGSAAPAMRARRGTTFHRFYTWGAAARNGRSPHARRPFRAPLTQPGTDQHRTRVEVIG